MTTQLKHRHDDPNVATGPPDLWRRLARGWRESTGGSMGEAARFATVGVTGVIVNSLVLALLHGMLGVPLVAASIMAVEAAIVNNFVWNDRWTFAERSKRTGRFLRFNLVALGGLALNTTVLALIVSTFGMNYLFANLIGIAAAMSWNFVANSLWTWRPEEAVDPGWVDGLLDPADIVIVPTYNEAENIRSLAEAILDIDGFGLLVVDDGSPDGTGAIAGEVATRHPGRVAVLHRTSKDGLGAAYRAGIALALAMQPERIHQMDADHSHDPRVLEEFRRHLRDGADLVIGSRWVDGGRVVGWPWWRMVLSRGGSLYSKLLLRLDVSDLTGGFKGWSADALRAAGVCQTRSNGYAFQVESTYRAARAGAAIREVPITFEDRRLGSSKMGLPIVIEAVRVVPALRIRPPAVDPIHDAHHRGAETLSRRT